MRELTRDAARRLDEAAQQRFGIPGVVLMENAARAMADIARAMLGTASAPPSHAGRDADDAPRTRVVVVCGTGNNGGDGYAIARHLANAGINVEIAPLGPPRAGTDAACNESICRRMELVFVEPLLALQTPPDLVVDAVFGTGLDRPVVGRALDVIRAINRARAEVLAVDLPSGLDNDTGQPFAAQILPPGATAGEGSGAPIGEAVRATVTAVTVAPRPGMRHPDARRWFGRTRIVDIGTPASLLLEFGTEPRPLPSLGGLVRASIAVDPMRSHDRSNG
jgi:NAD(P)H-hydrate epimerase